MKKMYFKKAMSLFMAVIMLLSCWVWVAPTEASAAAGSYYVKISWECTNAGNDYSIAYPGYANRGNGNCVGISLYYKSNNGTGTESEKYWDLRSDMETETTYTETATISGFPTRIFVYNDHGGWTDKAILKITKIEIGSSSTSTLTTIWGGTISLDSTSNIKWAELKSDYSSSSDGSDDVSISTTTKGWTYPYANTFTWSNTPEAMTCPKTASDSAATQTVAVTAKDQYGVQMFDPTWSVKGSNKSTGITVSPTTSSGSTTISVTSAANIAGTTNSQTGTVTATWTGTNAAGTSIAKTSSKTFTINDATYTATFKNHRNADGVIQSDYTTTAQYGVTPTAPTASNYSDGDYDYKFMGWSPTVAGITADTTYTADYDDGTFVGADYTGVNDAIAAANAIKAQYGAEYEFKYTHATRTALDSAINDVVTGLGRTQQSVVDGYAQAINAAIAALEPNKFDVIFLDKNGAIILYEKDAEYKESVTPPTFPEDQKSYFDADKHYTYTGWDTDEYTSVVDDLVISPVYTAEAHDWNIETVTSTCVQAGTQKYTCKVCGYVKYDGGDQLGDHVWATDFTVDLEPTCTVAGSKSIHCTLCDAQKDITEIPPLGHNFTSQSVAVEASCGKIGIITKVCDDCLYCEHTIIPALEHDYVKTTVAPTCTTKGYDEYVCQRSNCGHSYRDNYTDVIAHSFGAWETVSEAHCEVAGVKKRVCTECGFTELGSIDALDHDSLDSLTWNVVVAPTCEGKGYQTKTCSKCNNIIATEVIHALNHSYTDEVVAPTCTAKGYTKRTCSTCGDVVYTDETAALNHAWTSTTHAADCTHSSYIEHVCGNDSTHNYVEYVVGSTALGHNFADAETVVSAATCDADGEKTVKCTNCDETNTVIIPKLGHDWSDWVKVDATNDTDGSWTRTCKNNADHVETVVIPKGGHNLVEDTAAYKAPTCETKGERVYKCTNHENCSVTVTVELDLAQHTVTTRQKEATCTGAGTVEAYCSVCNKVFSTQKTPIKAHNFVAGTAVAPTCTTSGYTPYVCSVCSFTYNVYDASKPATGHSFTETGREAASCTDDGSVSYKCDNCTETKTEVLPKLGHSYVKGTVIAANCTTAGTEVYTCSCGDTYTKFIEAAKGHSWGEYTETQAATADKYGIKERTCSACNAVEIAKIAPIGAHNFTETVTKPATCTAEGEKKFTCSEHTDCAANYTETIPATGHTEELAYVAPSCFKEGSTQIICSVCDAELTAEQTIPMTAHTYDAGTITAQPTCTAEGTKTFRCTVDGCDATRTEPVSATGHDLTTVYNKSECNKEGTVVTSCQNGCGYSFTTAIDANGHTFTVTVTPAECTTNGTVVAKCDKCGYTETTTLEAKGHNFSGTETVVKEATCTAEGEKTVKCLHCDATTTVAIPAKGHTWDADWTVKTEATCEADGEQVKNCANCSEKITGVIPKLGHEWSAWKVTKASTNTEKGELTRTCLRGCTETAEIPEGGHNLVVDTENSVPATCTQEGTRVYKCSAHTDCGITLSVALPETQHTIETDEKAATCTEAGYVKTLCSVCKEVFTDEVREKIAHVYKAGTAVAPTCTTSGYTPYTCSCGDTYNVYDATKPATGHSFTEGASTASCTGEGTMTLTCENCSYSEEVKVPALGHNYVKDDAASTGATCAAAATETYKCSRCAASYTVSVGDKTTDHIFGEWQVKESATATSIGYRIHVCDVCGKMEVETIPATGEHVLDEEIDRKDATCTEDGFIEYKCSTHNDCGLTSTVTLPKLGHTETLVYTPASCEAKGSTKLVCSVESCKAVIDEKEIDALGHAWGDGTVTPATCVDDGKIEYSCTRTDCNGTKTVILPKNYIAHDYATTITQPTCIKEGSIVTKCTREGCRSNPVNEKIAKIDHTWGTPAVTDATCEADGSKVYNCTTENCTATKTEVITKLGHDWGEWTVTKDSTNTEKGELSRTCSRGCTETAEIPAGGHNLVITDSKTASCIEEGYVTYDCDAHKDDKDCGITVTVTLDKVQHEYETTKTDATCEGTGTVVTKCKNCDTATITTTIPATGHTYGEGVKTDATCTATGKIVYTCKADGCGKTREVILEKLQHSYKAGTPVAATCTTSGYTPYKCETCESSYVSITAPADGHDFSEVVSSTASCTAGGKMTLKCADCDETMTADVPALGHDYVIDSTTEATCAAAATETYKCSRCTASYTVSVGSKTEDHDWNDWVTVEQPTYTSIGYKTRTCKICDKLEVETLQKSGEHNLVEVDRKAATCEEDGFIKYKCNAHADCGVTDEVTLPKLGHTEELQYKAATCEEAGYAKTVCTVCDETIEEKAIAVLGHVWGNEKITLSTCTEKGKVEFTCTSCNNATKTVELPLNADAHKLVKTVNPASCTADGSVVISCELCKKELEKETLLKVPHTWNEWVVTTPATNSVDGEMTRTCAKGCTETAKIPAGGHIFGQLPSSVKDATCTTEGEATYKCTAHNDCGVEITVKLDKIQHTITTEYEAASCTKTGYVKTYCTVCKEEYSNITIGKLAHEFEAVATVDPTCTSSGYTTYKCKNCDEGYSVIGDNAKTHNYKEVENSSTADCENAGTVTLRCDCGAEMTVDVPALGHDWVTGEVTKATCQKEGKISFDCSRCDAVRTETLPKVSHDLETTVTDATCTTDGKVVVTCKFDGCDYKDETTLSKMGHTWADAPYKSTAASCEADGSETYKCINCTEEKTVLVPALGHVYEAGEKVAPTCLTSGYTVYVCKNDNSHKYNVYNENEPALDHDWGEWVTTPSTNTEDGKMERSCQRDGCSETETVTIPKGSHAFSEENATVTTPATCTSEGEKVYKCTEHTDCGVSVTVTLAKIAHTLDTNVEPATCTENGKVVTSCTECDTVNEETVIPATGHTYDGGVKTDATCTKEGKIVYTCEADGCGDTREVILDKLQHNFVAGEEVAATCTSNGYIPYSCSCGESYVIITAPAKAHNYIIGTSTADCENAGVIVLDCEFCDSTIEVAVPALGHDWGKGTVTKAPTCVDKGEITFKCTRCDGTRTEELDTIVHELTTVTTDATCTTDGSVVTTCKHCDYEVTTVIKKKGHTWADTPDSTVDAKCEQTGSATYKCLNCTEEKTVEIPALGHVYEAKEKVAPTCLTSGYTVYVCKHDNTHTYNVYDETQPATDHTWSGWTVVTNATEDTDGLKEKECNICHKKAQEVIPAMKHNMTEVTRTESTCSSEGSIVYKCSVDHEGVVCSYTLTVTLGKTAHTLKTELTPATCEVPGSVVTSCTKCDAVNETTVLPATGHKYVGTVTTPASCENEGVMTYVCENNAEHTYTEAIPATGHKYVSALTPPTCTAQGFTTHTCACGESYVDSYVDKLGHTFGEWTDTGDDTVHTRECVRNGCDSKETQKHKWDNGVITTEPTYDSEGEKTYTCHICDATKTEKVDSLVDNTAPSGKIKWEATIWDSLLNAITFGKFVNYDVELEIEGTDNETGIRSIEYHISDKALTMAEIEALTAWTAYDEVNKLTVNAVDAEKFVVYAKLTDNNGNITYISTDGIVFDTTDPVLDITADNGSDADKEYCSRVTITISEENFKEAYLDGYYVPVKNGSYSTNEVGTHTFKVVDMAGNTAEITFTINDGHTASEPVRENLEGGFNCTEGGSYDSVVYCAVCGEEMSRVRVTADPAGHKYQAVVTPPTCTAEGYTTHTCSVCGDSYVDSYVEKAEHKYEAVVTVPTCTEKGYTTHTCSVCGDSYVDSYTEAENHSWGAWVTDKKATCTESGEKHRVCQNDANHVETVTVKVLGHSYGEWIIDKRATCLEDGEKHRVCQNDAAHVETVAIKATGHSISDWYVTDEPTCTEEGAKARKCAYCDYTETDTLPAKGHTWDEWVVIEGDCELGYKHQRTCTTCGETVKEGFRPGSHTYRYDENGNIIYDDIVYPTCTKDGYYIYDCDVCGGGEVIITVETPGYEEELKATGHNFGEWIIVSEPTCFREGTKYRVCANDCKTSCGLDTESREYGTIPAKQHEGKWIAASGKDATCNEDGYTDYHYCADCGFDQGRVVIPAKGHNDSDGDMKCDSCGYNIYSQDNCDCMCHDDNWFMHNLYKLLRFFWKLFKMNKSCACGYEHY